MSKVRQETATVRRGRRRNGYSYATALSLILCAPGAALAQEPAAEDDTILETIIVTAEEQLKQAPGVSTVTSEDIEKMPGASLSGTTASGQRGYQRQIELRGMGPENTLILIDGKPVLSRSSVRMGRAGERDSRGDTNWVPAEAIERIEVIRGPCRRPLRLGCCRRRRQHHHQAARQTLGDLFDPHQRPEAFRGRLYPARQRRCRRPHQRHHVVPASWQL